MSTFKGLNLVTVERSSGGDEDPSTRIRNRFNAGIAHQIAVAKDPKATKEVSVYKDGERSKEKRKIKSWVFQQDGNTYTSVKYGAKQVALDGKNKFLLVAKGKAKTADVVAVFEQLNKLCEDGEFDKILLPYATKKPKTN